MSNDPMQVSFGCDGVQYSRNEEFYIREGQDPQGLVVKSLNNESGEITIVGAGNVSVSQAGQVITVTGDSGPGGGVTNIVVGTNNIDGNVTFVGAGNTTITSSGDTVTVNGGGVSSVTASGTTVTGALTMVGASGVTVTATGTTVTVAGAGGGDNTPYAFDATSGVLPSGSAATPGEFCPAALVITLPSNFQSFKTMECVVRTLTFVNSSGVQTADAFKVGLGYWDGITAPPGLSTGQFYPLYWNGYPSGRSNSIGPGATLTVYSIGNLPYGADAGAPFSALVTSCPPSYVMPVPASGKLYTWATANFGSVTVRMELTFIPLI